VVVPNPVGDSTLTIACFRLGLQDDTGILVVGSARADFPTKTEMLLLRVALNQAAIGLQESLRLGEQQRAAAELERSIAERTSRLTTANESLLHEILQGRRVHEESLALKDELAEELTALRRLHNFTSRLLATSELQSVLQEVLNESMALQNADFGNVQLIDPRTGALEIVAQKGFQEEFLTHFRSVQEADSACGRALQQGQRVIIEDVVTDEAFAPHRQVAASAGFRAVQSTPLFSRNGEPLGMLSTHFRAAHRPSERELRLTDLYVRQAAELIERKRAEQMVRESEGKYRTLFESIDEGFCTIEVLFGENETPIDYRFLEVNPAFEKLTGIKHARGRRMREIAPQHEEHWFEIYGKIALTGEPARFENRAEQLHRWYDVYAFRVGNPQDRKVAILFNDITERKRVEEALRESEERFRRYFDLGLVGMAITSPTKGCLEVNDELCRILGYRREELLRLTWAQLTHPDDLAADVANFNRVLAGEIDGYSIDKRWVRKDGRIIASIMAAKCVRRANGTVDYFVGLVQDITERKRAEEEQRKLAALVENSPDFIGLASLDGAVYIVNPAGRMMVGLYSAAQVAETRIQDYVAEEDRAIVQEHVLAHVLREGEWEGEMRFRHFASGAIIPTRQHIFLIKDPGTERPVAMATIARDITERKRSEEALRAARDQLAHIARVTTMGELAASIAHEVNQPLTAVVTNGDAGLRWLSQSPPNVDEAQKAMKEMVKQGHRASDVISRIRALLRKTKPNISSVDTRELIEEVLTFTRQRVEEHGVTVKVEVASDIPLVIGDSVQLQQVLVNLILNALEATGAARNSARELLVTSQCLETNEVVIAVHDSGTGIDPQYLDQLFRPFFTTKGTGLGMGLAISRSIVEAHGGRLWATSKEGQGATFQFSLPICEAN
jgi:PAS domain S-box-containing protein